MSIKENKVAVVTGSSSGIGYQTALILARNGFSTFATMRSIEKSKNIMEIANKERLQLKVIQLDVNDDSIVKNTIDKIVEEGKRIDVLVNNAGYGIFGIIINIKLNDF